MSKNIYRAGDGTWMLDLPEGQETSYGTNYIQGRTKKDVQNEYNDLLKREASKHMNKVIRTRDSKINLGDVIFRWKDGRVIPIKQKEYQLTDENLQQVIDESISQWDENYAKLYMTKISPDDFLKLTSNQNVYNIIKDETTKLDISKIQSAKYVADMIYLDIDLETGQVYGHEGRHRMMAFKNAGYKSVDLVVWARNYDKYNAKEYNNFEIKPQYNDAIVNNYVFDFDRKIELKKLVPVSKANVERIKKRDY